MNILECMEENRTSKIMFLSRENAARSQMAEGLLKCRAPGRFDMVSAGTMPIQTAMLPCGLHVLSLNEKG
jgi:protein-tyrosine-phosphatase